MNKLAVIIPWRDSGDLERRANYTYVHNYYLGLDIGPVIVSGDGEQSGPFNRSAAYNRGMARVEAQAYLWNEADVLIPRQQIESARKLAATPGNILPFTERHELDPAQTHSVLARGADPFAARGGATIFADRSSIGSAGVTSAATLDLIGGRWDEGFSGWGWDDNAMHHIFGALAGSPRWIEGRCVHLYHKPGYLSPEQIEAEATAGNAQRYQDLLAMPAAELRQYLAIKPRRAA